LFAPITNDLVTWSVSAGGVTIDSTSAAVYAPNTITLTISNDCGVTSDEIMISLDEDEPQVSLDPVSLCEGELVMLDATQPFDAQYLWSTGSTSPSIRVTTPGDYFVSVMTDCYFSEGSVLVSANDDCNPNIYIPNVFSPNGDNVNEVWEVLIDSNIPITGISCSIFDRWGDQVYSSTDIPVVWDGNYGGKPMAPGVYAYVLRIQEESGRTRTVSGDITLIR
jgi:gliding motility-associated-like protein